jgi:hypothetical protein
LCHVGLLAKGATERQEHKPTKLGIARRLIDKQQSERPNENSSDKGECTEQKHQIETQCDCHFFSYSVPTNEDPTGLAKSFDCRLARMFSLMICLIAVARRCH